MSNDLIRIPASNASGNPAADKLRGDEKFRERYLNSNPQIRNAAINELNNTYKSVPQQTYNDPNESYSKDTQKEINRLMKDRAFLERYTSNDPKTRATAVNQLNSLFEGAYGNKPITDELTNSRAVANGEEGSREPARQGYIPENPYISSASEDRKAAPGRAEGPRFSASQLMGEYRAVNGLPGRSANDVGTAVLKDRRNGWNG